MKFNRLTLIVFLWFLSISTCIAGYVQISGPLMVLLLGYILVSEKSAASDWTAYVMPLIVTAAAIWFGIQQQDKRQEQVAYWAHRQTINCRDADRWEAFGTKSKHPKPPEAILRRCANLDDASNFRSALKDRGW